MSDELQKTWKSTSLAVKITAVVVWGVMPIAFALTIPLISSLEDDIRKDYWWTLELVHEDLQSTAKNLNTISIHHFKDLLPTIKKHYHIPYIQISMGDQVATVGHKPNPSGQPTLYQHYYILSTAGQSVTVGLTVQFPSIERGIELERMKYGSLIVTFTIILGLYLVYVIRNVLHEPFQTIIDATQSVTRGDLNTRLDIQTDDEFGHLSNFFNHMVEELAQQQKKLTNTNKNLERMIHNKDLALAESQAKSLFLANMSHEIRTPMTAILGYAESLYHFGTQDREQQKDALETIYRNSKHLVNIINDILDLSKIEADKLQVEAILFSPLKMMQEVEQLMSIQAKEKGIQLKFINEYPLPEKVCSDPTRLKQVLFNLISNAIRFTDQGHVSIIMKSVFERNLLIFSVIDQGIGLTAEQIKNIFQPYVQAETSTARKYGGTGLGLMIARRLINLMGGKIRVSSQPGKGSVFKFAIKTGDLKNTPKISREADIVDITDDSLNNIPHLKGKVLLVEDIVDNQKLISMYLKQTGLSIDIANNGYEGVTKAREHHYNLILMDMQMPVMDGLEATKTLRESGYEKPIVALTANVLKNETDIYLAAGCNAILSKPIVINKFYSIIKQYLSKSPSAGSESFDLQERNLTEIQQPALTSPTDNNANDAFTQLVKQFLTALNNELDSIDAYIDQNDWGQCQKIIHNIKGRGGSFGFPEITEKAEKLDALLKNGQNSDFTTQFIDFNQFCRDIIKHNS